MKLILSIYRKIQVFKLIFHENIFHNNIYSYTINFEILTCTDLYRPFLFYC